MCFKDAILSAGNDQGGTTSSSNVANVPTCAVGSKSSAKNATADSLVDCLLDSPPNVSFSAIVCDC